MFDTLQLNIFLWKWHTNDEIFDLLISYSLKFSLLNWLIFSLVFSVQDFTSLGSYTEILGAIFFFWLKFIVCLNFFMIVVCLIIGSKVCCIEYIMTTPLFYVNNLFLYLLDFFWIYTWNTWFIRNSWWIMQFCKFAHLEFRNGCGGVLSKIFISKILTNSLDDFFLLKLHQKCIILWSVNFLFVYNICI